jgi:hypothetical protein
MKSPLLRGVVDRFKIAPRKVDASLVTDWTSCLTSPTGGACSCLRLTRMRHHCRHLFDTGARTSSEGQVDLAKGMITGDEVAANELALLI